MSIFAQASRTLAVQRARKDPAAFAAFVLRDGRTGLPVTNAPMHAEMHALMNMCPRLAIVGAPETGKSEQISIARVLWELGRDPSKTIMLASASMSASEKLVDAVAFYIEHVPEVREVFPHLRIASKSGSSLRVVGAPPTQKDPSLIAVSPDGASGQGIRTPLAILDDTVTRADTRTPEARDRTFRWYLGFVSGRLTPDARVIAVGNAHHRDDLVHRLGRLDGWTFRTYPIVDRVTGRSAWPARWPLARIDQRRREVGATEWTRTYLCDATTAEEQPAFHAASVMRAQRPLPNYVFGGPHTTARLVVVTVDPAFGVTIGSDWTGLSCAMLDHSGRRELLEVQKIKERLDGIGRAVFKLAGRWGARVVGVESNGGGSYLADDLRRQAPKLRVVSMPTTSATREARIAGLSAELDRNAWTFPDRPGDDGDTVRAVVRALISFRVDDHLPDDVSALMLASDLLRAEEHKPKAQVGAMIRDGTTGRFHFMPQR